MLSLITKKIATKFLLDVLVIVGKEVVERTDNDVDNKLLSLFDKYKDVPFTKEITDGKTSIQKGS